MRIGKALALTSLTVAGLTAGCADYGYGGYGEIGTGYGARGYYADAYDDGYDGYGYGGYGWYGDFYYPGAGFYVYDRGGRRHRWSDDQRRHWEARRDARRGDRAADGRDRPRDDRRWAGRSRSGDARVAPDGAAVGTAGVPATADAYRGRRDGFRGRDGTDRRAAPAARGGEAFRGRGGASTPAAPAAPRVEMRARGGGNGGGVRARTVQEQ